MLSIDAFKAFIMWSHLHGLARFESCGMYYSRARLYISCWNGWLVFCFWIMMQLDWVVTRISEESAAFVVRWKRRFLPICRWSPTKAHDYHNSEDCHLNVHCLENLEIFQILWRPLFITMFTRAHCWSLSRARWIQPTSSYPVSLISSLILSSLLHLSLSSGLF